MKYKVNISIDDVSPHPQSSVKVLDRCFKLIEEFKDIKFTLFVPIAYWRTFGSTASQRPYYIYEYPDFCECLKNLPKKNFEINVVNAASPTSAPFVTSYCTNAWIANASEKPSANANEITPPTTANLDDVAASKPNINPIVVITAEVNPKLNPLITDFLMSKVN